MSEKRTFDFPNGEVLLINKPLTWTSFSVVNKIRWLIKHSIGQKLKVGHAGTLDPLATGLLIICTGKQTKNIDTYQGQEKEWSYVKGSILESFRSKAKCSPQRIKGYLLETLSLMTSRKS